VDIPEQDFEEATESLNSITSPRDDDTRILNTLKVVRTLVQVALEKDPKLKVQKGHLANRDEFRNNVKKKGEQKFIDSLRAMAANSDEQGSKAWEDLFEDSILFSSLLGFKRSDRVIRLEVFWKKMSALHVGPLHKVNKDSDKVGNDFKAALHFFNHI